MSSAVSATTSSNRALVQTLSRVLSQLATRSNAAKLLGAYFLYIVFKYRTTVYGYRLRPDLKGPPGHPLVGNLWGAVTRPREQVLQNFTENHEKYGKVYTVTLPSVGRIINIIDPEMLDHVLRVNFWAYEKGPRFKRVLQLLVGEGIFSADGEHWKWQRKLASNIFNVKAFRHYTSDVFCQEGEIVIEYLNKVADTGKAIDLQELFYCFTLDSFGEIAFGQSFGCLKDPDNPVEFAAAFDRLNHGLSGRFISVISPLKDWWTGNGEKLKNDSKLVRGFALNLIHERRRKQQEGGVDVQENPRQKDLLQLFMDMKLDNGEVLSDDMLVDSVLNFIIAGRDTTAQALSWMFYLMHRSEADLNVWKRLVQETDDLLKGSHPTYESTKQQKYAESCLYEALRLYPSVPKNIKTCIEDDVLPGGIPVYKGDRIGWSSWSMGRDTSIWGPDAKEYKPERWLNSDKPSPAKFNAFHLGPRTCLGQQFATIEAITIMSMLAQKFTFELVDPKIEPAYKPSLTLPMAQGLPVRIKRRVDSTTVA